MAHDASDRPERGGESAVETGRQESTVGERRLYGAERHVVEGGPTQGLLTVRELRYLAHANRLERADRNSLYKLLSDRIDHFLEAEWPMLEEAYPEYADRVRDAVCEGDESTDQRP